MNTGSYLKTGISAIYGIIYRLWLILLKAWKLFWDNAIFFAVQSVLWVKQTAVSYSASKDSARKLLRGSLEFIWEWFCKLVIVHENPSTFDLSLPYLVHIHNFFGVCYI